MKNIFLNQNIPVSNSLILNNYSIQNLIISPTKIITQSKVPIIRTHYIVKHQNSFSPSPQKINVKNMEMSNDMPQNNFFGNYTPLQSYKSAAKLKCLNLKSIPNTPISVNSSQNIINIPKMKKFVKTEEKHPQDSKKNKLKKNPIIIKTNKKILKNSISQRVFKTIKKPFETVTNITKMPLNRKNEISPQKKNIFIFKKKETANFNNMRIEPKGKLVLEEFPICESIGKGTFGKIYCVKWNRNNKLYALKKEILFDMETIEKRKNAFIIITNFIKNTKSNGLIRLYANLCLKNINSEFQYYELMEKAERDWNQEINVRAQYELYYKENEILNIMRQLISTLSLLQKNHITHRDIKPQNILVINGKYKLCDFGEIRVLKRNGLIVQRIRGSELYMSPILFHGLHLNLIQVRHNTYKSDVFSLGMCLFYASSLTYIGVDSIRELTNMNKIKEILFKHLGKRYSAKLISLILVMLEVNEEKRPDFIQLEMKMKKLFC